MGNNVCLSVSVCPSVGMEFSYMLIVFFFYRSHPDVLLNTQKVFSSVKNTTTIYSQ